MSCLYCVVLYEKGRFDPALVEKPAKAPQKQVVKPAMSAKKPTA